MNKFIGEMICAIATIVIVLSISVFIYLSGASTDKAIVEAIKTGADPLEARCALASRSDSIECALVAAKINK